MPISAEQSYLGLEERIILCPNERNQSPAISSIKRTGEAGDIQHEAKHQAVKLNNVQRPVE